MNAEINLDYANALTLLVPPSGRISLVLVGCGGTGSWLAPAVARIGKLLIGQGIHVDIQFIDPDVVEEKNTIRQNFCAAEIGQPKATALALRYAAAWGIEITSREEKISSQVMRGWNGTTVFIGCVDNAKARKVIADCTGHYGYSTWWLDCGNEKNYGQVLLGGGNCKQKAFDLAGYCTGLPIPSEQHPELIEGEDNAQAAAAADLSCAEMTMADSQGLSINQRVAAEAADYLVRMLITKDLKKHATYMDLESGTTRSRYIVEGSRGDAEKKK